MNTVRERGYAKVNLYLDVLQKNGEYHDIDSVVCSIDLFDEVTVTKRKDDKIVLRSFSSLYGLTKEEKFNNAYRAAELFKQTFNTDGVNVTVRKNIPVGGGLGGSGADVAATLRAMKKLFYIDCDLNPLADSLGSDARFLLRGGFARLRGRGIDVTPLYINPKLHFLIATPKKEIAAKDCYNEFDKLPSPPLKQAEKLIENLTKGIIKKEDFYNALYAPACRLNAEVERVYGLIAGLSPSAVFMTGSGSSVVSVFETRELCEWAKDKLKRENLSLFVTESLTEKETESPYALKNPFIL